MKAYAVAARRVSTLAACAALLALPAAPLAAQEIYRWIDENGVVNFSDTAPAGASGEVSTLVLEDTTPADYDPEQDIYNLEATAQRMQNLREDMAAEREARRERAAAQPAVVAPYPEPQHFGYADDYLYGYPPLYPRPPGGRPGRPPGGPPHRPPPGVEPPVDDTATWRPLGQSGNRGARRQ